MAHLTGAQAYHSQTSEVDTTQHIPFGTRARDKNGNEFIYVDFQEAVYAGEWVVIGASNIASGMAAASSGPLGVCVGTVSASDHFGWVQVYGECDFALATSNVTTAATNRVIIADSTGGVSAIGCTTDTTAVTELQILGVKVLVAPTTATTLASSSADVCTVHLNYPWIVSPVT